MKNLFYLELKDAEYLKDTYTSWIGKEAHVGKGQKEKLKEILIRPKSGNGRLSAKYFSVEFLFDRKKFSAQEFLFHNSLEIFSTNGNRNPGPPNENFKG